MTEFSHSFVVARDDIDEQGHVNNVVYVRRIQDVDVAHWFSLTTPETREKFTWVVLRHEIDYKKAAFENEEIMAATWVGEPARVSWERFKEIRCGTDLLIKAKSNRCLIDRRTMKPMRITEEIKEILVR